MNRLKRKAVVAFAGAGGSTLGLRAAGFDTWDLELDPDCCAVLRALGEKHPEADLSNPEDWPDIGTIGLLWASPPCQPWSDAGKRGGSADDRNGWPWLMAGLDRTRPRWVVAENVGGILKHRKDHGPACGACYASGYILPELRKRFAWANAWTLDAASYGVPQHRKRVFFVAGPHAIQPPLATHGPLRPHPYVGMAEALGIHAASPLLELGETGWASRLSEPAEPARTVGTKGNAQVLELIDEPAPTVTTTEVKGTRACRANGWAPNGGDDRASDAAWRRFRKRRLTVEECATLQGFPAGHPFHGSKVSRYRQVGNAVPPAMAEAIGRRIMGHINKTED